MHDACNLEPPPYQRELIEFLRTEQAELWQWFSSHRVRAEHSESARLDLLKTTYRIDRDTQPRLYELADAAARGLALDVPLILYQAQQPLGLNASIASIPGEAHVVLHGPLTETLDEAELHALFAHELTHFLLAHRGDGDFLVAEQLLAAMTNDVSAEPAHFASDRLCRLYTEILCDRGALASTGNLHAAVATLVKVSTGLRQVSAESYLRQADEIFSQGDAHTEGVTHPESFIRARALRLWHERGAEAEDDVRRMIEGPLALASLDLLGQRKVAQLTRRLIDAMLSPAWIQTEGLLAHAGLYFDEYARPAAGADDAGLADDLATTDEALRDYYCYVLLDFVTADRDLEEAPLAAAFELAGRLDLSERFEPIARKELSLTKKQFERIQQQTARILSEAAVVETA
jgi:hypothetical protein